MLTNLWGDGLPLWPATRERVDWILAGQHRFRARTCSASFRRAAASRRSRPAPSRSRWRAGGPNTCRCSSPRWKRCSTPTPASISCRRLRARRSRSSSSTARSRNRSGSNSGFGCLGPDPQQPAGASIGRALRLLQQNVGGARARRRHDGDLRRDALHERRLRRGRGGPARGLAPHGTERHGFAPGTNSVSLVFANGVTNVRRRGAKKETPGGGRAARACGAWRTTCARPTSGGARGLRERHAGHHDVPRVVAQMMAEHGWTKRRCASSSGRTRRSRSEHLHRAGAPRLYRDRREPDHAREHRRSTRGRSRQKPDNIVFVVAGGGASDPQLLAAGDTPRRARARDPRAGRLRAAARRGGKRSDTRRRCPVKVAATSPA